MSEWHIQDVGTVSASDPRFGVRLQNIGFDLGISPSEARELAKALTAAADAADALAA
jgi:hypothetical protein